MMRTTVGVVGIVVGQMQPVLTQVVYAILAMGIVIMTGLMGVRRTLAQTYITALTVQQTVEIILYATIRSVHVR